MIFYYHFCLLGKDKRLSQNVIFQRSELKLFIVQFWIILSNLNPCASVLDCPSFFEKPIKPAVKPVQKRRPIIWISLEPHFVNVSPFRHHWSPFVTILSPPLLLFYSKFIWIFIFLTPRLTCVRGCSRSDSKPPLSNHVANCVALQLFKLQNWDWKLRDKCRRITFPNRSFPWFLVQFFNGNQNLDRILRVDRTIYKSGLPYHKDVKIWVAITNFPKDRIRQCDSNQTPTWNLELSMGGIIKSPKSMWNLMIPPVFGEYFSPSHLTGFVL